MSMCARGGAAGAAALIGLCLLTGARSASAQTTDPILRVETGMHTTLIRRVVVDPPRNRLITASDDKTVRVWQMPEARLLSVLRVPMDAGHEGQLFALAVSPDGKTVAAAGWTGWDWEAKGSIYFFDVTTGDLVRRFNDLNETISAMAWSPDGQYLAVGLQSRGGFRVIRADTGAVVANDPQYNDKLLDIDFSPQGRIITVALDGMVRLYAPPEFRLIGRRVIPGGQKPITVRYAPSGDELAIGYIDTPAISIASGRDLSLLYQVATDDLAGQVNLSTVVWSSDGRYLYAGGDFRGSGLNPLYRWPEAGRGQPERIPLMRNRITEIQQMPEGRIAFAAEDPGLGIVSPDGRVVGYRGPDIVNFSAARTDLLVSADGGVIGYPLAPDGSVRNSFAVLAGGDQAIAAPPAVPVFPPRLSAPGVDIRDWQDGFKPTINGKTPELDDYEMSRSYAIAPDGRSVVLGTEWAVRRLDLQAREIWTQSLPAVAWAVNISQNGEVAVAALSDGTVRWYRMRDGREVISYFPHGNGLDWMAWTPDGYYTSSVNGDNYIGWHLNRGKDLAPDFYRAVQFDRILYRPDVFSETFRLALANGPVAPAAAVADATFKIDQLRQIAPPRLKLLPPALQGLAEGRPRATFRLEGEKNALAIKDYAVFVNGVPITPSRERTLSGGDADRFSRTVEIDLPARTNEIRVEAFNGVSMGTAEAYIGLPSDVRPTRVEGNLYVLAVGVNAFPNLPASLNLAFAAQDAEGMAQTLERRGQGHYARTFVKVLSDDSVEKPTRGAILSALEFVQQGGAHDTVVIFLASHGITDPAGNYYFVPSDVERRDVVAAQRGEKGASLVSWTSFFEALRGAAGRRLLIVDTCHAGSAEGSFDSHSLMKRSASSMFPLIVASKGEEKSQEYQPGKHGLFTYALMNALAPAADADGDLLVSLREAFRFAVPIVEELRDKTAGGQTPQMVVPPVLGDVALVGADR
ncbi:MAG TPA: caspase family protein [Vicinamibacterales bacterium]|nr:caspase family protein [Vicinamibacterales bacterium]